MAKGDVKGQGYGANPDFGEGTAKIKEGSYEVPVQGTAPTTGNESNSSGHEITSKTK